MESLCSEKFICSCSGNDSCMLPSRCMLASMRSAPSAKLPPLYVPMSPVARPPRFKQCPVALVPTLGCSRRPDRNLDLLISALYGHIIPEGTFSQNGPHISRTRPVIPQETPAHPDAFARASTSARQRGGRAPVSPCLHPCPCTHGEIRGRNGPGRSAREPHTNRK